MKKGGTNPPSIGTDTETITLGGKKIKFRKGALHRQLKIPEDQDIGNVNLRRIKKGEVGDMVKVKGRMFKITKLLKKRATFGLTLQGKK